MDAMSFENVVRSLSELFSRRTALELSLGAVLAGFGIRDAVGKKRRKKCKKKCGPCKKCKKGKCKAKPNGTGCGLGKVCQSGICDFTPSAFCVGKNECEDTAPCQSSGDACSCFVIVGTGAPFCGLGASVDPAAVDPCAQCNDDEACVDLTGCLDFEAGCSRPCAEPL